MAQEAARLANWTPHECSHALSVRIFRARNSGDMTNFIKSIEDGSNKTVFPDDRFITEIHAYMTTDKANPRVEVEVSREAA